MKKIIFLIIQLILFSSINAQQLELKELTAPSSPAFTLLGLNPTNISRPTSFSPFVLSLANGIDGSNIGSDIAIESTPFWWKSQKGLTYEAYYGLDADKTSKNILDQVKRTFSFSLASSDASPDIDSIDSRNLAAGFRFQLLNGDPSKDFTKKYDSLNNIALKRESIGDLIFKVKHELINTYLQLETEIPNSIQELIKNDDRYKYMSEKQLNEYKKNTEDYIKSVTKELDKAGIGKDEIISLLETERGKLTDQVNSSLIEMQGISRVGWLFEFASAASLLAPTNKLDYTISQDWASWATLTYRLDSNEDRKKTNDFNLMVRVGGNFQNKNSYNRDFGINWVNIGIDHSISFESIFRSYRTFKEIMATDGQVYQITETNNTWRFALSYQYRISEFIDVSLTAGKDFENSNITAGGIFSLINLNFSLPSQQFILVGEQ